jgi:hypothetical protein
MPSSLCNTAAAETMRRIKDQPKTSHQIPLMARAHGSTHQTCQAVPPRVVQPRGHAGASAALGTGTMRPGAAADGIPRVGSGVDQLATVRRRHTAPPDAQTLPAAITHDEGQHRPRQSRDGHPAVARGPLPAVAHHPRVDRQRVALQRWEDGLTQPEGGGLLLSVRRRVSRLTLRARATARGERRARRKPVIRASCSGVTRRACGTGVQRWRQTCPQSRCGPERLVPKRTTGSAA